MKVVAAHFYGSAAENEWVALGTCIDVVIIIISSLLRGGGASKTYKGLIFSGTLTLFTCPIYVRLVAVGFLHHK